MATSRQTLLAAAAAGLCGTAAAIAIGGSLGAFGSTTDVRVSQTVPAPIDPIAITNNRLPARGFDAQRVYAVRGAGVVTINATFATGTVDGAGFVVDAHRGLIVTNSHVVTTSEFATDPNSVVPSSRVDVGFPDGERAQANVLGFDLFDDVALLQVPVGSLGLVALPLGHSRDVHVGEPVMAIGNPEDNAGSASFGIVSAVGRQIRAVAGVCFDTTDAIQTDAALNHGSSGGPLLDARGKVIGITSQIQADNVAGIGFAVPADAIRHSMTQLLAHGHVVYAWLGVRTRSAIPALAAKFNLPVAAGAIVQSVSPGSAAASDGLSDGGRVADYFGEELHPDGDIIVRFGNRPIDSFGALQDAVAAHAPGDTVTIVYWRAGVRRSTRLTLTQRPSLFKGCHP